MPHWSFLKATTGTGAMAASATISDTTCACHLNPNPNPNQVHTALAGLGDLTAVHEQPLAKRMGPATKAGLAAIAAAQPAASKL